MRTLVNTLVNLTYYPSILTYLCNSHFQDITNIQNRLAAIVSVDGCLTRTPPTSFAHSGTAPHFRFDFI